MTYCERLVEIFESLGKGFLWATLGSAVFLLLIKEFGIGYLLMMAVVLGPLVGAIIYIKEDGTGCLSDRVGDLFALVVSHFFDGLLSCLSLNPFWVMFAVFKLMIGLILMLLIAVYAGLTLGVNFIYFGIMAILEHFDIISWDDDVCLIIDQIVSVSVLVVVVVVLGGALLQSFLC